MTTADARRRRLIALKSPIQAQLDGRPRCEECKRVLSINDFQSYWDGTDPHVDGCIPRGHSIVPRICMDCNDQAEREGR